MCVRKSVCVNDKKRERDESVLVRKRASVCVCV